MSAGATYYVRRDATHWFDFGRDSVKTLFEIEGRHALYACSPFMTANLARRAALEAGLKENEFEIVEARIS